MTFIYGAFETVYDGAIRAVVPSIVPKADLPRANSRIEAGELVVQNFISGPLTSLLFAVSVLIPLGINGLVFALAGGLALALPKAASGRQFAEASDEPKVAWHRQFLDGFKFIVSSRMLVTLWLFSTFVGIVSTRLPPPAGCCSCWSGCSVPEALFGVFMLSGAVGGILGAMLANRLEDRARRRPDDGDHDGARRPRAAVRRTRARSCGPPRSGSRSRRARSRSGTSW